MAEEELIEEGGSGEEFLRNEEAEIVKGLRDSVEAEREAERSGIVTPEGPYWPGKEELLRNEYEEQPEVVEIPQNVDRVQAKQAQLQQEINIYQSQINELANKMETAQLAFQQCVVLLQVEEATNGS